MALMAAAFFSISYSSSFSFGSSQHVSKFDITFTLDFLFIFFKFLIKFVSCFHVSAIHFVLKKHLI